MADCGHDLGGVPRAVAVRVCLVPIHRIMSTIGSNFQNTPIAVVSIEIVKLRAKGTFSQIELAQIFQYRSRRQLPQTGCADPLLGQKIIDELIKVGECISAIPCSSPQLSVICQHWFQRSIDIFGVECEANIECGQSTQILKVILVEVFEDDVSFRHELEKLESEAKEWRGFLLPIRSPNECHVNSPITQSSLIDGEALFFPVVAVHYSVPHGLLQEMGRVLVMDLGAGIASLIKHAFGICLVCHDFRRPMNMIEGLERFRGRRLNV